MHFLRENKTIIPLLILLPIFFLWADEKVILWVYHFQQSPQGPFVYDDIIPIIKILGHGLTVAITALLLCIVGKYAHKGFYKPGRSLLIAYATSGIAAQVLKHLFGRARPRITEHLMFAGPSLSSGYDSFPSGHAAVMFCVAYVFSRLYPKYAMLFYGLAVIVGVERVLSHSHFPSDIIGGAGVGLIIAKELWQRVLAVEPRNHAKIS